MKASHRWAGQVVKRNLAIETPGLQLLKARQIGGGLQEIREEIAGRLRQIPIKICSLVAATERQ